MNHFVREDWALFRSLGTLCQKAGVPADKLPRLVVKELVDNALDICGTCRYGELEAGGFYVEDDGEGIGGGADAVSSLFSIARPLTSSKLLRLPTRGALGNGLRVVAGAVLATGGELRLGTRGQSLLLTPQEDGTTTWQAIGAGPEVGTRIEVILPHHEADEYALFDWAKRALELSGSESYIGKTSPFWYDEEAFFELCRAAVNRSARDLIAEFDGCSGAKAGQIAALWKGREAASLLREEATTLLAAARSIARPVKPERLGFVGEMKFPIHSYAREVGVFTPLSVRGTLRAELPFVIEVWARLSPFAQASVSVNRTPITAEMRAYHQKNELQLFGCNLGHRFKVGKRPIELRINVQTPYMPITTDGKEPDLKPLLDPIYRAVEKAVGRAKRNTLSFAPAVRSQKDLIIGALPEAIIKASGEGQYRFSLRQLFYAVRPYCLEYMDKEPDYNWFCQVIGDYESLQGEDIPQMYRDARGTLYHPHEGRDISLGTLAVEEYQRPAWTFNKILYSEKEGFFSILKSIKWPERHDCALLTTKGFASRAARDVIDLLGDTEEELLFFCIHDADGPGTAIYEALQEGTRARPGRKVRIVNLGLEPEEALQMQLQIEKVERKGQTTVTVARYVDAKWREWLQTNRVELNAMTTPQFLKWLDAKIETHSQGKVVPPRPVLAEQLASVVEKELRDGVEERILLKHGAEAQAQALLSVSQKKLAKLSATLDEKVRLSFEKTPEQSWPAPIEQIGSNIAADILNQLSE